MKSVLCYLKETFGTTSEAALIYLTEKSQGKESLTVLAGYNGIFRINTPQERLVAEIQQLYRFPNAFFRALSENTLGEITTERYIALTPFCLKNISDINEDALKQITADLKQDLLLLKRDLYWPNPKLQYMQLARVFMQQVRKKSKPTKLFATCYSFFQLSYTYKAIEQNNNWLLKFNM